MRAFRKKHPDYEARMNIQKLYGLSWGEYNKLLEEQGGLCAICRKPQYTGRVKRLSVDHNHKTKKIRGLLCSHCNRAIGLFMESVEILRQAIEYLRKYEP